MRAHARIRRIFNNRKPGRCVFEGHGLQRPRGRPEAGAVLEATKVVLWGIQDVLADDARWAMADDAQYVDHNNTCGSMYDAFAWDELGRAVFMNERRRGLQLSLSIRATRCYFYQIHRTAQVPRARENGWVLLENRWVGV